MVGLALLKIFLVLLEAFRYSLQQWVTKAAVQSNVSIRFRNRPIKCEHSITLRPIIVCSKGDFSRGSTVSARSVMVTMSGLCRPKTQYVASSNPTRAIFLNFFYLCSFLYIMIKFVGESHRRQRFILVKENNNNKSS